MVPKALKDEFEKLFKNGEDLAVFGVEQDFVANAGTKVADFLTQPQVNMDAWQIIDRVAQMFDKRVGLSDLMYGYNPGAASRTAEDANIKRSALSVRPDHMLAQVEEWQTEVANLEHVCTQMFITPNDVVGRMGSEGAMLWERVIMSRNIDDVLRDTQIGIEAGTSRKPNKDTDSANITQALQIFMPVMQAWSQMTGNPDTLNAMITEWGKANDMDTSGMMLPAPPPPQPMPGPPPEEGQQAPPDPGMMQ